MADQIRLDDQLCFPLYAASRLLARAYQKPLAERGLTYTQYIVLMILWEDAPCSVTAIGERAMLNSNTLTPLLKRLQQQGLIERDRDACDERRLVISLTEEGRLLEQQCVCIPETLHAGLAVAPEKLVALRQLLDDILPELKSAAK
ncbi:MAG: MarR family winged helix-turn-helix transcriptional regulator [Spongiibacteraceae bacterium]